MSVVGHKILRTGHGSDVLGLYGDRQSRSARAAARAGRRRTELQVAQRIVRVCASWHVLSLTAISEAVAREGSLKICGLSGMFVRTIRSDNNVRRVKQR